MLKIWSTWRRCMLGWQASGVVFPPAKSLFPLPLLAMRLPATIVALFAIAVGWAVPARPYTLQFADSYGLNQIRWTSNTIRMALSTSLLSPGANVKPGTDVMGAAHRALSRWSSVANIKFVETSSNAQ